MDSLRSEKSAVAMQKTGVLIVEEIKRKREGNQKKIQELVDFLRQEIQAARSKVCSLSLFDFYIHSYNYIYVSLETCT